MITFATSRDLESDRTEKLLQRHDHQAKYEYDFVVAFLIAWPVLSYHLLSLR